MHGHMIFSTTHSKSSLHISNSNQLNISGNSPFSTNRNSTPTGLNPKPHKFKTKHPQLKQSHANQKISNTNLNLFRSAIPIHVQGNANGSAKQKLQTQSVDEIDNNERQLDRKRRRAQVKGNENDINGKSQHFFIGRSWKPGLPGIMKILSWNCRGLSNPIAIPNLQKLAH